MAAIVSTAYRFFPQDTGYVIQIDTHEDGTTAETMVPVAGAPAAVANYANLVSKARVALTANQTFLALASPTNAQAVAQTQALTRQVDALIYFLLHEITGLASIPGV